MYYRFQSHRGDKLAITEDFVGAVLPYEYGPWKFLGRTDIDADRFAANRAAAIGQKGFCLSDDVAHTNSRY